MVVIITSVQFLGFRFNGADWPLVLLEVNGKKGVYEYDALVHLIHSQQPVGPSFNTLEQILNELVDKRYELLPDMSDDDFSGQSELF